MLPKTNRINKKVDFARMFKTATKKHHPQFTIMVTKNSFNQPRFGFIVSKKVGNSVVRHRVVRMLREAVHTQHMNLGGYDVVVIAKPQIVDGFNQSQFNTKLNQVIKQA